MLISAVTATAWQADSRYQPVGRTFAPDAAH
jgi:hypothetical protein